MFVMVFVIGLLVDDVIVVVENVECVMIEENLFFFEVICKLMDEIKGVFVGIVMVFLVVFVFMVFFLGFIGVIYC